VTNCNLKHVVSENGFRGDLYYRLNRFPIEIRTRPGDEVEQNAS